jgi:hypothetical protein
MARATRKTTNATASKLATHEAVCAERYAGIMARIGRLEALVIISSGALICALFAAVWQLSKIAH